MLVEVLKGTDLRIVYCGSVLGNGKKFAMTKLLYGTDEIGGTRIDYCGVVCYPGPGSMTCSS